MQTLVLVPAAPLLFKLPANMPGKAEANGPTAWDPITDVEDLVVPGSLL